MTEEQFDFDSLAKLAQSDPEAFEEKRLAMIGQLIEGAPEAIAPAPARFSMAIDMNVSAESIIHCQSLHPYLQYDVGYGLRGSRFFMGDAGFNRSSRCFGFRHRSDS